MPTCKRPDWTRNPDYGSSDPLLRYDLPHSWGDKKDLNGMSNELIQQLNLGSVEQVAYVVTDMDSSLPAYQALFGPFEVSENELPDCTYRGQTADLSLKMAVNNSGPIEIEILQPMKGESPLTEHLRDHGEGLHHVRFRVEKIDEKLAEANSAGFETLLFKRFSPEVAFAYLQTPSSLGGHVIEFLEMP